MGLGSKFLMYENLLWFDKLTLKTYLMKANENHWTNIGHPTAYFTQVYLAVLTEEKVKECRILHAHDTYTQRWASR